MAAPFKLPMPMGGPKAGLKRPMPPGPPGAPSGAPPPGIPLPPPIAEPETPATPPSLPDTPPPTRVDTPNRTVKKSPSNSSVSGELEKRYIKVEETMAKLEDNQTEITSLVSQIYAIIQART